ncbi:MAG: hypothetical protein NC433_13340 [Clostridiales bacterium]|nr:hypothetical protein [Clostridiales bacterium]
MERIQVTDEWLYKYMPLVDTAIIKELESQTNYEYQFSDKFERRMKKQIRREAHPWINIFVRQAKKAAVLIICASGLIFLLSMSVAAYRNKFFETMKNIWEDSVLYSHHTDIGEESTLLTENKLIEGDALAINSESIYLNREDTSFSLNDNHISFPQSAIIAVTKKIAGRDMTIIQDKREDIIDFINSIENSKILSEAETINPNAHLLGIDFSIVLLTMDSERIRVNFSVFDDDRICIYVISDKEENDICFWLKSSEAVEKIKALAEYRELNGIKFDLIEKIELSMDKGESYQFSEKEIEQMKGILKRANIKSIDSNCLYDINFIFYVNGEELYAKFCNDSCKLLAIEGHYFELEEEDANWILEIVGNISTTG